MDGRERHPKAVRQRRPRRDPDRRAAGFLPKLEQPGRSDGIGLAFHPGGFRAGDRPGGGRLDEGKLALESTPLEWNHTAYPMASWFETCGVAALLTMRV